MSFSDALFSSQNGAMSGTKMKHIHIYKRVKHPKRRDLWMCAEPNCSFRTNQIYLEGKEARCPYCNHTFIITKLKLKKQSLLHCDDCKRGGTGKKLNAETPSVLEIERQLKGLL
jgi:hypothetical protein